MLSFENIKQPLALRYDAIIVDCLIANTRKDPELLCIKLKSFIHEVGPIKIEAIIFDRQVEKCIESRLTYARGVERDRCMKAFEEFSTGRRKKQSG